MTGRCDKPVWMQTREGGHGLRESGAQRGRPWGSGAGRVVVPMLLLVFSLFQAGCAMVSVRSVGPTEYVATKRGDILMSGELSRSTQESLRVLALDPGQCAGAGHRCIKALMATAGIPHERRLAALAELWLARAGAATTEEEAILAWMESARHAYAYLFFTPRRPGERSFEDRQTQVRDYYNYAVQEASIALFRRADWRRPDFRETQALHIADWVIRVDSPATRITRGRMPDELLAAASLSFTGLRGVYRQDGFGAELLAMFKETDDKARLSAPSLGRVRRDTRHPFSEMPAVSLTVLFLFEGRTLDEVLDTRSVLLRMHDPHHEPAADLVGEHVPLAGNFTAGFGLWLARSGFASQAVRTLIGREQGIDQPHVYLMQPFDPDRRVILMLHGLASSPEAWVNVANEVLGDDTLRRKFQIWQIYYPTNAPMIVNQAQIRQAIADTFAHFDPGAMTVASRDVVVIGHSMGGVLGRLLVSSSGDRLRQWMFEAAAVRERQFQRIQDRVRPMLEFEPLPGASRAIFIAAPHRGTPVAGRGVVRWLAGFIRLPVTLVKNFNDTLRAAVGDDPDSQGLLKRLASLPTSINNLDAADSFIRAAIDLPISPAVPYHSIIARSDVSVAVPESDDGLVPYWSSHLAGAASELVITSEHSVQETAQAILEVRRILHEDIGQGGAVQPGDDSILGWDRSRLIPGAGRDAPVTADR